MTPSEFTVTDADFQSGIELIGPGPDNTVNKIDCATPAAATRFAAHLHTMGLMPIETMDWPLGVFTSRFAQASKVPYFDFPYQGVEYDPTDPTTYDHENVAGLIVEYTVGYSQQFVDDLMVEWFTNEQQPGT
jgi:hypothetical protein